MRSCSPALALVLDAGGVQLWNADLFTITLADGSTVYRWTSFDQDVTYGGNLFTAQGPFIQRSKWDVANTMQVPTMDVRVMAFSSAFAGGASIKLQAHNGLFDGATVVLERAFMLVPGDAATLGTILLFSGQVAGISIDGTTIDLSVKGLVNKLDSNVPRNVYQTGCIHTFCDPGCTLLRATFTTSYVVGSSPTKIFIPWVSAPGTPGRYFLGTVTFTSGAASGQRRSIQVANGSGLTLSYPLPVAPLAGDTFNALEGCDNTLTRCTALANQQNFRGFEFVPIAETAY